MTSSLYHLCDPRNGGVRYVGYSHNPDKRFNRHLKDMGSTHKCRWLSSLRTLGLQPILVTVCVLQSAEEAKRMEVAMIAMLRKRGIDLTNTTPGGDGVMTGRKHEEATRKKMSDNWTPEKRSEASLLRKGIPQSQEQIEATKAANTPELLARRGAAIKAGWERRQGKPTKKKGRPSGRQPTLGQTWSNSEQHRQRCRDSWTPERRAVQAERMRIRRSNCG